MGLLVFQKIPQTLDGGAKFGDFGLSHGAFRLLGAVGLVGLGFQGVAKRLDGCLQLRDGAAAQAQA